jgi:hypothetical protein
MYKAVIVLLVVTLAASAHAQPPKGPAQQASKLDATKIPNPADAVRLADLNVQTLPENDQPFYRYLWTDDTSKDFHGAFNYALNTCVSHSGTLYLPTILADGHLIRIDTRRLWPRTKHVEQFFPVYEELALIDPYFHTRGVIVQEKVEQVKVTVPRYRAKDGKTYDYKFEDKVTKVETVAAEHAIHLGGLDGDMSVIQSLSEATASQAPILNAKWFIRVVTSSNSKENGRYIQFRGFKKSQKDTSGKVVKSAEQLWLESLGLDYEKIKNELQSDQRIGKWRSNITGKPRAIEYVYTPGVRAAVGPVVVTLTRDYFTGSISAQNHPIKNLLNYKFDGTEAIGPLPNGMLSFLLFDAAGELVEVAPQELVSDRTVPSPHPADLQAPISCIRCHGPTEMWMDTKNDVMAFTKGNLGVNIYDDESDEKLTPEETLDRISSLYTGELAEPLRISRNTHAKATFLVTGGMDIPDVAKKISDIYQEYRYDPVTPQVACRELGYDVSAEQAAAVFNAIVPKLPPNRHGIRAENVMVATLRAWSPNTPLYVNRDDWEQEFSDTMLRVVIEEVRKSKTK